MSPELRPLVKKNWNVSLGREGERLAAVYLESLGWRVMATNWRNGRFAEVDLIALTPDRVLVFVEVKTRCMKGARQGFESPGQEALHSRKQRKLLTAARIYMEQRSYGDRPFRIDAIIIEFEVRNGPRSLCDLGAPSITHIQNAFGSGF